MLQRGHVPGSIALSGAMAITSHTRCLQPEAACRPSLGSSRSSADSAARGPGSVARSTTATARLSRLDPTARCISGTPVTACATVQCQNMSGCAEVRTAPHPRTHTPRGDLAVCPLGRLAVQLSTSPQPAIVAADSHDPHVEYVREACKGWDFQRSSARGSVQRLRLTIP